MVVACTLAVIVACAGAPRASTTPAPLTSVDTAYYQVPGSTRAEWAANLPRAATAAGIVSGAPSFTVGHVMWSYSGTRTTSIGCQVDRSIVQLRLGHVMPRLMDGAAPSSSDRATWDAFVGTLWDRAHVRESIGAAMADSLRAELRRSRTSDCTQLIQSTHALVAAFPARYAAAILAMSGTHESLQR
jgi:predicted secreted Zn-dependent protease